MVGGLLLTDVPVDEETVVTGSVDEDVGRIYHAETPAFGLRAAIKDWIVEIRDGLEGCWCGRIWLSSVSN